MLSFNVKSNVKEFTRGLTNTQKRQIPFATARALTRTAQAGQKDIQEAIPNIFNTTKKWWLKQQPTGIKIKPAKKTDLEAVIYTRAYFAKLQEQGGIKTSYQGGGILVPTERVPKYGRKSGGAAKVIAGKKILRRGGKANASPFLTMKSGHKGVFRRKSKKTVELLYTFTPRASIQPRFGFHRLAMQSAKKHFGKEFHKSLKSALRTAR